MILQETAHEKKYFNIGSAILIFSRSQAGAFLVPKPQLGNALAGEAPASLDGRRPEAGLRAQMRSQAGAWERGNAGAWERGNANQSGK